MAPATAPQPPWPSMTTTRTLSLRAFRAKSMLPKQTSAIIADRPGDRPLRLCLRERPDDQRRDEGADRTGLRSVLLASFAGPPGAGSVDGDREGLLVDFQVSIDVAIHPEEFLGHRAAGGGEARREFGPAQDLDDPTRQRLGRDLGQQARAGVAQDRGVVAEVGGHDR